MSNKKLIVSPEKELMLSKVFLIKQKKCCGNGCKQCPYENQHSGESRKLRKDVLSNLEIWEIAEIEKFDPSLLKDNI